MTTRDRESRRSDLATIVHNARNASPVAPERDYSSEAPEVDWISHAPPEVGTRVREYYLFSLTAVSAHAAAELMYH